MKTHYHTVLYSRENLRMWGGTGVYSFNRHDLLVGIANFLYVTCFDFFLLPPSRSFHRARLLKVSHTEHSTNSTLLFPLNTTAHDGQNQLAD